MSGIELWGFQFDIDRCVCVFAHIRFLVHRYSEMQRHVEADAIEGVDDVDTAEADKTHYNDDSDEVSVPA